MFTGCRGLRSYCHRALANLVLQRSVSLSSAPRAASSLAGRQYSTSLRPPVAGALCYSKASSMGTFCVCVFHVLCIMCISLPDASATLMHVSCAAAAARDVSSAAAPDSEYSASGEDSSDASEALAEEVAATKQQASCIAAMFTMWLSPRELCQAHALSGMITQVHHSCVRMSVISCLRQSKR